MRVLCAHQFRVVSAQLVEGVIERAQETTQQLASSDHQQNDQEVPKQQEIQQETTPQPAQQQLSNSEHQQKDQEVLKQQQDEDRPQESTKEQELPKEQEVQSQEEHLEEQEPQKEQENHEPESHKEPEHQSEDDKEKECQSPELQKQEEEEQEVPSNVDAVSPEQSESEVVPSADTEQATPVCDDRQSQQSGSGCDDNEADCETAHSPTLDSCQDLKTDAETTNGLLTEVGSISSIHTHSHKHPPTEEHCLVYNLLMHATSLSFPAFLLSLGLL